MLKNIEKRLNNRLVDFVIGGSYLNEYWTTFFENIKKIGLEAYAHILVQYETFKKRYRE